MNFKKTVLYSLVATFLVIGLCGGSGTKANEEDSNKSENVTGNHAALLAEPHDVY